MADGGRLFVPIAERDAGLIADHEERKRLAREQRQRFARAGGEAHERWLDVVGHVVEQRAVFVEKNRGLQHDGDGAENVDDSPEADGASTPA